MDPIIYEQNRIRMAHLGMSFGIAALVSSIFMFTVPFIGIALAAVAILLCYFSKGSRTTYCKESRIGFTTSLVALAISVFIFYSVFHAMKTNPDYRKNVTELFDTVYKEAFTDEEVKSIEDMMDSFFGE